MPIDATPFIDITPRGHRPRAGKELRVCFTSCTVDPTTLRTLNQIAFDLDVSRGAMLDRLAVFALKHGFVTLQKQKAEGPATTPQPSAIPMPKPHSAAGSRSVKSKPAS